MTKGKLINKFINSYQRRYFEDQLHVPHICALLKELNIDPQIALSKRCRYEFDKYVTIKASNFDTVELFQEHISTKEKINQIKIPCLLLNSLDDQLIPVECIPISSIENSENLIELLVAGGGHIEYLSGIWLNYWAVEISCDYLKIIQQFQEDED